MEMNKLNKTERLKSELKPYDFLDQVDQIELKDLSERDRFYLKNFGIYNHKLSPESFMLRIRITAGRIELFQLEEISKLSKEYSLGIILTVRAQIELHGIGGESVLLVRDRLEKVGLTTWQTLTDNLRNIITDPLDGISKTNKIEVYPLIERMESLFLKNPDFVGTLPRKFNTAICGDAQSSHSFFNSDLYFALAKKDDKLGFNLFLGGKNSEMAECADIFVSPQEVFPLFEAVIQTYLRYGLRGTRSKTRLFHLLQKIGMDTFRRYLSSYCSDELHSAGVLQIEKSYTKEFTQLSDGHYAFCHLSHFGEISGDELSKICGYAREQSYSIRLGIDQNIHLIGLKEAETPLMRGYTPPQLSVCAGSRYCTLSLFDMKSEAELLPLERLSELHITVGYSGCLKGCGKHQHVDIGLVGLRTSIFGSTQKSVRLFIGGQYTYGKASARLILMAVPLHGLNALIHVLLDEFVDSGYSDFEHFSLEVLNKFSTNFLALWFLSKLYFGKGRLLKTIQSDHKTRYSWEEENQAILETYPEVELSYDKDAPFYSEIRQINQMLFAQCRECL